MPADHRGADIAVAEEFLNGANVVAVFQKMSGNRMAKGMGSCRLGYPRFLHGFFHRFLQNGFVQVVSAFFSGCPIYVMARCRKYPLPSPFFPRVGIFAIQSVRQCDTAESSFEVTPVLLLDYFDVLSKWFFHRCGKHCIGLDRGAWVLARWKEMNGLCSLVRLDLPL